MTQFFMPFDRHAPSSPFPHSDKRALHTLHAITAPIWVVCCCWDRSMDAHSITRLATLPLLVVRLVRGIGRQKVDRKEPVNGRRALLRSFRAGQKSETISSGLLPSYAGAPLPAFAAVAAAANAEDSCLPACLLVRALTIVQG